MTEDRKFRPTEADGRRALRDHVLERAHLARAKHGPDITPDAILRILDDRSVVRYPVTLRYDPAGLRPGEFAHAEPLGDHPAAGYCLYVHPDLLDRPELLPLAVAYHLPPINYGDVVETEDCEAFGAALLGLGVDAYYDRLCALVDSLT